MSHRVGQVWQCGESIELIVGTLKDPYYEICCTLVLDRWGDSLNDDGTDVMDSVKESALTQAELEPEAANWQRIA